MFDVVAKVDGDRLLPASVDGALASAGHFITYQGFTNQAIFAHLCTYNYRIAVFDEGKGFGAPSSRTATHVDYLRHYVDRRLRTHEEPIFVLAMLGTPMGPNLVGSANLFSLLDVPVWRCCCGVAPRGRSSLRRVAFGLLRADCFVPSRGTSQFFGGLDANPHKAEAILRQAMAVDIAVVLTFVASSTLTRRRACCSGREAACGTE